MIIDAVFTALSDFHISVCDKVGKEILSLHEALRG